MARLVAYLAPTLQSAVTNINETATKCWNLCYEDLFLQIGKDGSAGARISQGCAIQEVNKIKLEFDEDTRLRSFS